MGFLNSIFGKTAGFGAVDVDNFDGINRALGRAAGDQVMAGYARLTASLAGTTTILNEAGFRAYFAAVAGEPVRAGPRLVEQLAREPYILCRPYSSGDEFLVYQRDERKVRALMKKLVEAAEALELPIRNEAGVVDRVLRGIPLSTGTGPTRESAWRSLLKGRESRAGQARPSIEDRVRPATPAEQLLRDGPQTDPKTGLPTSIEIVTEPTPAGHIPILMWGPVEVRRPGWNKDHQQRMYKGILALLASRGITDVEQFKSIASEVEELADQVWRTAVKALVERSKR